MNDDSEKKRAYVSDLYSGPKWKQRVARMTDSTITAIYLDHQDRGRIPRHKESSIKPPEPEKLVDISAMTVGPHANEDEFEIY